MLHAPRSADLLVMSRKIDKLSEYLGHVTKRRTLGPSRSSSTLLSKDEKNENTSGINLGAIALEEKAGKQREETEGWNSTSSTVPRGGMNDFNANAAMCPSLDFLKVSCEG